MPAPDVIAEIVALLSADNDVSTLAAAGVFGGGIPESVKETMPQPAVVVTAGGGPGRRGYNKYRNTRVDTTCYGQTLKESEELHRAVREVLENVRRSGSLFWAQTITDGLNAIDRVTQWPTCYAGYLVMSATDTD